MQIAVWIQSGGEIAKGFLRGSHRLRMKIWRPQSGLLWRSNNCISGMPVAW